MTDFKPYRKGTILAPSGRAEHLHIICNDPVFYPINDCFCVLAVNISSLKDGVPHDPTCILQRGDHDFIKHDSYVVYERAVIWRVDNIIRKYDNGEIRARQDISEHVFNKILLGFEISDETEPRTLKFCKSYCS